MEIEKIREIVDGYIEELKAEFARYARDMVKSAEDVEEEIEDIGLPQDMFISLWDPQAIFYVSRQACTLHTERIFQLLEGMDPEDEQIAREMIARRLRVLVSEFMIII